MSSRGVGGGGGQWEAPGILTVPLQWRIQLERAAGSAVNLPVMGWPRRQPGNAGNMHNSVPRMAAFDQSRMRPRQSIGHACTIAPAPCTMRPWMDGMGRLLALQKAMDETAVGSYKLPHGCCRHSSPCSAWRNRMTIWWSYALFPAHAQQKS
jgi:hypothetical protein